LSRIRAPSSEKKAGASIRSTCATGVVRGSGGATASPGSLAATSGRSANASWTAWASAEPPSPSTCVAPAIRTIRVGARMSSAPAGRAAPVHDGPAMRYVPAPVPVVRAPTDANTFVQRSTSESV
jgi:hypothetical protein